MIILNQDFVATVSKEGKVTYTTETDDESKQVEVDIEEDGNDKRIIFLKVLLQTVLP